MYKINGQKRSGGPERFFRVLEKMTGLYIVYACGT